MISVITLGVSDLDRAVSFYRDGLGLPYKYSANSNVSYFTLAGSWLALYPREKLAAESGADFDAKHNASIVLSHNVDSEAAVISFVERATNAGAKILKPPHHNWWGGFSSFIADPEGYTWEVVWNPKITAAA